MSTCSLLYVCLEGSLDTGGGFVRDLHGLCLYTRLVLLVGGPGPCIGPIAVETAQLPLQEARLFCICLYPCSSSVDVDDTQQGLLFKTVTRDEI